MSALSQNNVKLCCMDFSIKSIDDLLLPFSNAIGKDYSRYRNHVYRVFLNCLLLDKDPCNEEKYAIAAVFHDIGIWTDHTIDYLNPSIAQTKIYLVRANKQDLFEEVSLMIYWHHKISSYQGSFQKTVENFRKADWIDVSLGFLTYGVNNRIIRQNRRKIPNLGFHIFLLRETTKNFLKHPLNPLPMFTQ